MGGHGRSDFQQLNWKIRGCCAHILRETCLQAVALWRAEQCWELTEHRTLAGCGAADSLFKSMMLGDQTQSRFSRCLTFNLKMPIYYHHYFCCFTSSWLKVHRLGFTCTVCTYTVYKHLSIFYYLYIDLYVFQDGAKQPYYFCCTTQGWTWRKTSLFHDSFHSCMTRLLKTTSDSLWASVLFTCWLHVIQLTDGLYAQLYVLCVLAFKANLVSAVGFHTFYILFQHK